MSLFKIQKAIVEKLEKIWSFHGKMLARWIHMLDEVGRGVQLSGLGTCPTQAWPKLYVGKPNLNMTWMESTFPTQNLPNFYIF